MKHPIDPKVDCVFKALLGRRDNSNLLIHFLNAMLADQLESPIQDVVIENPFNEKEFLTDKLSIVDVRHLAKIKLPALLVYGSVFCVAPRVT